MKGGEERNWAAVPGCWGRRALPVSIVGSYLAEERMGFTYAGCANGGRMLPFLMAEIPQGFDSDTGTPETPWEQ